MSFSDPFEMRNNLGLNEIDEICEFLHLFVVFKLSALASELYPSQMGTHLGGLKLRC